MRRAYQRAFALFAVIALVGAAAVVGVPTLNDDGNVERQNVAVEDAEAFTPYGVVACAFFCEDAGNAIQSFLGQDAETGDTDKQTKANGYIAADNVKNSVKSMQNFSSNYQQFAYAPMLSRAKMKMAEMYQNGATTSEMQNEGRQVLQDSASEVQANLVRSHNRAMTELAEISEIYRADSSIDNRTLYTTDISGNPAFDPEMSTENITLSNGSKMEAFCTFGGSYCFSGGSVSKIQHYPVDIDDDNTDEYEQQKVLRRSWLKNPFDEINTKIETYDDDIGAMANAIASNFSRSEINATDVTSPWEQAQIAASNWNSTGDDKYADAFYRSLGYDANLTNSFEIKLEDGTTLEGQLFSEDALTSVVSGETYYYNDAGLNYSTLNSSEKARTWNTTDTVFFRHKNGQTYDLAQNFTVQTLYGKNGEPINSTSFSTVDWETTNVSSLKEQLAELRKLQDALDDAGTNGIPTPSDAPLLWGIAVVLLLGSIGAVVYVVVKTN